MSENDVTCPAFTFPYALESCLIDSVTAVELDNSVLQIIRTNKRRSNRLKFSGQGSVLAMVTVLNP